MTAHRGRELPAAALRHAFLIVISGLFLVPIYIAVVNVFKTREDIFANPAARPHVHRAGTVGRESGLVQPFAAFVFVGYIRTVPQQLDESARLDGAGELLIFGRIITRCSDRLWRA